MSSYIPYKVITLRVRTKNIKIPGRFENGFPLRDWSTRLSVLDDDKNEVFPLIFDSITFHLHPTFKHPNRTSYKYPFKVRERGWGEFDIKIKGTFKKNIGTFMLDHPVLFDNKEYYIDYEIQVPYHMPSMFEELQKVYTIEIPATSNDQLDSKMLLNMKRGLNNLKFCTEDTVTEIVNMILEHPAVRTAVNNYPRLEDFYMDIAQFPDDLILKIYLFLVSHDVIKLDSRMFKGTNSFNNF